MFKHFSIFCAVLAGLAVLAGASNAVAQTLPDTSRVKLVTVYEKTFPDSIIDVVMDTITVKTDEAVTMGWKKEYLSSYEKTKGMVTILYPKLTISSSGRLGWYQPDNISKLKNIKIFDLKSKSVKSIPGVVSAGKGIKDREHFRKSPNGEYFLMTRYPSDYHQGWSGGSLYDKKGNKLWAITDIGLTPATVSDKGVAAFVCPTGDDGPAGPGGYVVLYDNKGEKIGKIENPNPDSFVQYFTKFSDDGYYILCGFYKIRTYLTCFVLTNMKGDVISKASLPKTRFTGFKEEAEIISGVGVVTIVTIDEKISSSGKLEVYAYFIDWEGNVKWKSKLEVKGGMKINISEDKQRIYISSSNGYIWNLNLNDGELFWTHKEIWSPQSVDDVVSRTEPNFMETYIISDKIFIKGALPKWDRSNISVFDKENGELILRKEYPNKQIIIKNIDERLMIIDGKKINIIECVGAK